MKQLLTILFVLLIGLQQLTAQVVQKIETFKEKTLLGYSMYFSKAELSENGQLSLTAVEKYSILSVDAKEIIMANVAKSWQEPLVLVNYGTRLELWGLTAETGGIQLLDEWDINATKLSVIPGSALSKTALHPWFFYLGGILGGDNNSNVDFTFNTRLGFFLLANKWDFATTFSAGTTGADSSGWTNFGLMSRVHFPIKNYSIRPNIGTSLQFGDGSPKASLSLGFMWFVGYGSIDVAINIGSQFTTMGGYTAFPKMKSNR